MTASYAISVRQARVLPAASFRFRVTPDTLAVQLTVPTIRVRRGLAPPSHKSATTTDLMVLTCEQTDGLRIGGIYRDYVIFCGNYKLLGI